MLQLTKARVYCSLTLLVVLGSVLTDNIRTDFVRQCKRVTVSKKYIGIDLSENKVWLEDQVCREVMVPANESEQNTTSKCSSSICRTLGKNLYLFNVRSGLVSGETIDGCVMDPSPCQECGRGSNYVNMFAGTPYETKVDVGQCGGQCTSAGHTCVPTSYNREIVYGPNGAKVVTVINQCSCQQSCYRVDFNEARYVQVINQSGRTSVVKKLFNVGRCTGSCVGRKLGRDQCLIWDSRTHTCIFPSSVSYACVPDTQSMKKHTYIGRDGKEESISTIHQCICSTG